MEKFFYPERSKWEEICQRPSFDKSALDSTVFKVLSQVKLGGDKELKSLTSRFDGVELEDLSVSQKELIEAADLVNPDLRLAIELAAGNIEKFHKAQLITEPKITTIKGVNCWRKSLPIEKVGLYIPGGSAPLFSTLLMLAIPAKIAGCKEIIITTPPDKLGKVNPVILYTANLLGLDKIFKVGGAQAIASLAYGSESVPKVYKIFGPGNQFVTRAKELVQQDGIAIDMPAGPSEVLVMADETSNPQFVAADLLSQAEHGKDSQVILVTNNQSVANDCLAELEIQLEALPRKEIASAALKNSKTLVFKTLLEAMRFSNYYAPEHLIISTDEALKMADKVMNAGSVFIGHYSCESAGDYASGTNHTLPTNGYARAYSGVSIDSFIKKITFQELSSEGIQAIGPSIELMATAENLEAHKNAVSVRLKSLDNV